MPYGVKKTVEEVLCNAGREMSVEEIAEEVRKRLEEQGLKVSIRLPAVVKAQLTRLIKEDKVEKLGNGYYRAKKC